MITFIKIYFTGHGWYAKTISIMTNAMHHARQQMLCLRII